MPVRTRAAALAWGRLAPWQQDLLTALGTFAFGALLYRSGLFALFGSDHQPTFWQRLVLLAAICSLQLLRRRAPGIALASGTALLIVDIVAGLSAPTLIVYSDLIYAATLYGSRRLSRAMIPFAALGTIAAIAAALVLVADWRVAVLAAVAALPFLITPVWWATNVRQYREIAEKERANAAQLAKIAELDRKAAVASERARMARDLHDVIAGHLSAIAIQSEAALSLTDAQPETAHQVLTSVRQNSVSALEEMRSMIGLLRSDDAEQDAPTAPARLSELSKLVESARASGMRLQVRSELDDSVQLPAAVDLTAYRIAQEALTNAVKHAPGGHARMEIRHDDGKLVVEVTNELTDSAGDTGDTGTGLLNMRERATAVGGSFSAGPSDEGWLVRAVLPVSGLNS